jgi:addiction module RelE/StbE family toxin
MDKWDYHIEPDWLLVYDVTEESVILYRTGTYADLF